jgi:hypothetical protein
MRIDNVYEDFPRLETKRLVLREIMPGDAMEALEALLHFGFEQRQLHRVEAKVRLGNQASMGVLQKLGFQEEGILRERI